MIFTSILFYVHKHHLESQPWVVQVQVPPLELPSNQTLVVIMGNLRGGEAAWKTLYSNLLDPNSADLAMLIGEMSSDNPNRNATLLTRAKYVWNFQEHDDWAPVLSNISDSAADWIRIHKPLILHKQLRYSRRGLFGGFYGLRGSGALVFYFRWLLVQHIKELGLEKKYTRFVITRADQYYMCQEDVITGKPLSDKTIWVPQGEQYDGYTDRHMVVSGSDVLDSLDILPTLMSHPLSEYVPDWMGAEAVLKKIWDEKNFTVKISKRTMFTVKRPGDPTRGRNERGEVPGIPTLSLKYPDEYKMAKKTCDNETMTPF